MVNNGIVTQSSTDVRLDAVESDVREVKIGVGACIARVDATLADLAPRFARMESKVDTLVSNQGTLVDELTKQRAEQNKQRGELASVHEAVEVRRWWVTLYRSEETRRLIRHLVTAVVAILGSRWLWGAR